MPPEKQATNKFSNGMDLVIRLIWFLVCFVTLGFPAKYRERLRLFEELAQDDSDLTLNVCSKTSIYQNNHYKFGPRETMRRKQQVSSIA